MLYTNWDVAKRCHPWYSFQACTTSFSIHSQRISSITFPLEHPQHPLTSTIDIILWTSVPINSLPLRSCSRSFPVHHILSCVSIIPPRHHSSLNSLSLTHLHPILHTRPTNLIPIKKSSLQIRSLRFFSFFRERSDPDSCTYASSVSKIRAPASLQSSSFRSDLPHPWHQVLSIIFPESAPTR